jgi:hypothetical protein
MLVELTDEQRKAHRALRMLREAVDKNFDGVFVDIEGNWYLKLKLEPGFLHIKPVAIVDERP